MRSDTVGDEKAEKADSHAYSATYTRRGTPFRLGDLPLRRKIDKRLDEQRRERRCQVATYFENGSHPEVSAKSIVQCPSKGSFLLAMFRAEALFPFLAMRKHRIQPSLG